MILLRFGAILRKEMMIMEETKIMTNEQLKAELKSRRAKAAIADILTFAAFVISFIMFVFLRNNPIGVISLILAIFFGYHSSENKGEIKKLLSENVVGGVVKEVLGDPAEYDPWGKISPGSMVLPFSYNSAEGSHHIKAVYNGMNIELGNIELINAEESINEEGITESSKVTLFKGQWLICDFGKELACDVYISEWTKKDRRSMKNNVTMGNELFDKRFCVRADDPQAAYHILTPQMMEYISAMADKSGGTVYLSFLRDGRMHAAIKTERDIFELGKGNTDVEGLRRKFLGELHGLTDIIDTLHVKELNV